MNALVVLQRHRSLRWLVPVAVAGVTLAVASGVLHSAAPSSQLPETTPAALLAAVRSPLAVTGFTGTVVSHVDIGLPQLPAFAEGAGGVPIASLLTGSHTLQVWYGGPQRQRIALLGAMDETDLFRSGRQVWRWSSADRVADHLTLPERAASAPELKGGTAGAGSSAAGQSLPAASASPGVMTPSDLAAAALAALNPSTRVSVTVGDEVADRPTYDLALRPRSSSSRIGEVRIAIDGTTKLPLGVQIYPRGSTTAAVNIAYTSIRFTDPPATYFQFTPPSGADVHRFSLHDLRADDRISPTRAELIGSNWSTVIGYHADTTVSFAKLGVGRALTKVSGPWGRGRLLETNLVCVLITHGGRIYAGAVDPSALFAAAGRK